MAENTDTPKSTPRKSGPNAKMLQREITDLMVWLLSHRREVNGLKRCDQKAKAEEALGFKVSDTALKSIITETDYFKGLDSGWLRSKPTSKTEACDSEARKAVGIIARSLAGMMMSLNLPIPDRLKALVESGPSPLFDEPTMSDRTEKILDLVAHADLVAGVEEVLTQDQAQLLNDLAFGKKTAPEDN